MTKTQTLNSFWSSFGMIAYDEASVPTGDDAPDFPYVTYQVITDDFGYTAYLTGSVWFRDSSWTPANNKAEDISKYLGRGGKIMPCDEGALWIKRGTPFAQSMGDPSDNLIKRKIINITVDFLTAD